MSGIHDAFVGAADEVTYGNAVAPTDFFEFNEENVAGSYERIESEGLRAGAKVLRSDRFVPNPKGATGDITMEVLDQGFDFWLKHMFGAVADGTATLGVTPHTATIGAIDGKSFSVQAGRPDSSGTVQPFTYSGGKVTEWELSNETDGVLMLSVTTDFASEHVPDGNESGAFALAVPSYPVGAKLLTFVKGSVKIAGVDFVVSNVSVTGNNGLKVDRYGLRGTSSTTKREPREEAMREYGLSLTGEFENTAHSQRIAAAVAADALATIELLWEGVPVVGGGVPSLKVTAGAVRFDEGPANVGGSEMISQELTAKILDEDLQVVYTASV